MKKTLPILVILLFLLSACGSQGTPLTGADMDAVLAYSEAKTDNLLAGMNAGDYGIFSKDFDAQMLAAMSEAQFTSMKADRDAKLGLYLSRQVTGVLQIGEFYTVIYDAKFEKVDSVVVRVVFRIAEPHQISGLWFNK